ncbi:monovalent cation:proton antiporter family protein [Cellvibrio japonicus]|uniref:Glutathione-regulated potassium-efflux system protein n=1 Tax=Cellvibrio japonicus (strain Ueda107) TaxID=498211 RepID=B3PG59_CELJU|nr:monovalent cation:proton antiporter family protein [Cellvibrio japonicus]ACE82850.1 glutathione-regulated potassium-efflux system protein [Cellvibrio japonicus Ueda107]QEI13734.1 sodium:proton exchanger [Cellvibrio japonicus]QEI17308.1 sodium:proton exchanger [Cellvibrio japonicus]QEI20885.1 sodium:proton exchanger [Cellvibrio japonicus]
MGFLVQILLLLGIAVTVVVTFQRLHIPSSLGYLLVGLILGPYTVGPVLDVAEIKSLAEFGIVFLLFTIGLNFSLPQLHALRHQVLGLGTGQVVLTTLVVGLVAWLSGFHPAVAFVIGAVFAQSSTTIIGKQLAEQGEENSRHGRLGLAMSVFQDVTAVPFVVVIPVLGAAAGADVLANTLGWAMAKAVLAFVLVFIAGRWLLRPLFHLVAAQRSAEVFTLTVLLVALLAAWTTNSLGLSMAFGAFLAGMMLGETEFRHQVESTIRPFRDVLLGLFFVGIGMLIDPAALPAIWHWALLGMLVLVLSKTLLVMLLVKRSGIDKLTAWRTGLLLAVGGEFGFALLAIALSSGVIDKDLSQIVLTSVLFAMIAGPFLIRYNYVLATLFGGARPAATSEPQVAEVNAEVTAHLQGHVIVCGYGRIGQSVGRFLEEEKIPYIALDLDPVRVREAHTAGQPVYYGDAAQRDILDALGLERARLVVISHDDVSAALKMLAYLRSVRPGLPVMVRTRDESQVEELQAAGALEVVPETLEAGLMIASQALLLLDVPLSRVARRIQAQRAGRYPLMREFFRGDTLTETPEEWDVQRLRSIVVPPASPVIGHRLGELKLTGVTVTALVRKGERYPAPAVDIYLQEDDVLVVFGSLEQLQAAEKLELQ